MMDNSPTTGSVNTSVAEKQRFAKTSLAFNYKNVTFKKLFPEYVEKYEEQQGVCEQPAVARQEEKSEGLVVKKDEVKTPKKEEEEEEEDVSKLDGVVATFICWSCNGFASAATLILTS